MDHDGLRIVGVFLLLLSTAPSFPSFLPKMHQYHLVRTSETMNILPDLKPTNDGYVAEVQSEKESRCRNKTRMLPSLSRIGKIQKFHRRFGLKRLPGRHDDSVPGNSDPNCPNEDVEAAKPPCADGNQRKLPPLGAVEKAKGNLNRRRLPKNGRKEYALGTEALPNCSLPANLTTPEMLIAQAHQPDEKYFQREIPTYRKRNCTKVNPRNTNKPNYRKMPIRRRHKLPRLKGVQNTTTPFPFRRTLPPRGVEGEEAELEDCGMETDQGGDRSRGFNWSVTESTKHRQSTPVVTTEEVFTLESKSGTSQAFPMELKNSLALEQTTTTGTTLLQQLITSVPSESDLSSSEERDQSAPTPVTTPETEFNTDAVERTMGKRIGQNQSGSNSSFESTSMPPATEGESRNISSNSFMPPSTIAAASFVTGEETAPTYDVMQSATTIAGTRISAYTKLVQMTSAEIESSAWKSTTVSVQTGGMKGKGLGWWIGNAAGAPGRKDLTSEATTKESGSGTMKGWSSFPGQRLLGQVLLTTESPESADPDKEVPFPKEPYIYSQLKRRNRYRNRRKETEFLFGPHYREYARRKLRR